jgi:3-oxoadipate enol-lactonase
MKVRINDIELYYEYHGTGEPIVFAHGWLDDASIWQAQADYFANTHTVILYDLRGHGRSDNPVDDYAVQTLSHDLYALTRKLAYDKIVLVGFSLGGMAAILFTLDHPTLVSKLVLVGATAKMTLPRSIQFFGMLRFLLPYTAFIRRMCRFKFFQPSNQMVEDAVLRALNTDRHAAEACWNELSNHYDVRDRVAEISVPTLIIVGEHDDLNRDASHYLHSEIRDSAMHVISGVGHAVMIENPENFNHILEEFIRTP